LGIARRNDFVAERLAFGQQVECVNNCIESVTANPEERVCHIKPVQEIVGDSDRFGFVDHSPSTLHQLLEMRRNGGLPINGPSHRLQCRLNDPAFSIREFRYLSRKPYEIGDKGVQKRDAMRAPLRCFAEPDALTDKALGRPFTSELSSLR